MISQTNEYALRAMTHLAGLEDGISASCETIASHTKVPQGYLSKILRDLVVAGLINSQRGPNGGFCLARPSGKTSILDIINAVDPLKRITHCPLGKPEHFKLCPLHRSLDDAIAHIERALSETTLGQLITDRTSKGHCRALSGAKSSPTALTTSAKHTERRP